MVRNREKCYPAVIHTCGDIIIFHSVISFLLICYHSVYNKTLYNGNKLGYKLSHVIFNLPVVKKAKERNLSGSSLVPM